jgi:hypothetical protein
MIQQILSMAGDILGWIPVPLIDNSSIANAIRVALAGLALLGAYTLFGGS